VREGWRGRGGQYFIAWDFDWQIARAQIYRRVFKRWMMIGIERR